MLEAAIYHLLKKHFRPESYYVDLIELFHEVSEPFSPFLQHSQLVVSSGKAARVAILTECESS